MKNVAAISVSGDHMAEPPHDPFLFIHFFSLVLNEKCLKGFEILPHPSHSYLALHMFKPWGPLEVKESKEVAEEEERSGARREDWAGIFRLSEGSEEEFKQQECHSGIYYKVGRDLWFSVSNNKCSFLFQLWRSELSRTSWQL